MTLTIRTFTSARLHRKSARVAVALYLKSRRGNSLR